MSSSEIRNGIKRSNEGEDATNIGMESLRHLWRMQISRLSGSSDSIVPAPTRAKACLIVTSGLLSSSATFGSTLQADRAKPSLMMMMMMLMIRRLRKAASFRGFDEAQFLSKSRPASKHIRRTDRSTHLYLGRRRTFGRFVGVKRPADRFASGAPQSSGLPMRLRWSAIKLI